MVWGPAAGYFVGRQPDTLALAPVAIPQLEGNGEGEAEVFPMAMGVRKTDESLRAVLETVLRTKGDEIRRVLQQYGVPLDAQGAGN